MAPQEPHREGTGNGTTPPSPFRFKRGWQRNGKQQVKKRCHWSEEWGAPQLAEQLQRRTLLAARVPVWAARPNYRSTFLVPIAATGILRDEVFGGPPKTARQRRALPGSPGGYRKDCQPGGESVVCAP